MFIDRNGDGIGVEGECSEALWMGQISYCCEAN